MVAIFTGKDTGLERGSGMLLGGPGLIGAAGLGRSGEQVSVNAANGNLVIAQRDEFLAGRGPDAVVARTYNSRGNQTDDNGDNWRQSTDRRIKSFNPNVSVVRVSGDGGELTYTWNGSSYVNKDGAGAYDSLTYSNATWTFVDGDTQTIEQYASDGNGGWRISEETDTNGVTLRYAYQGNNLAQLTTSTGDYIAYSWSGNRIAQIDTGYDAAANGGGASSVLTRTRYEYDGQGRLSATVVDLSPNDRSVADGKTYRTDYTYYGTSTQVKTIAETDGTLVEFTYDAANRVQSFTQTIRSSGQPVKRTTTLTYDQTGSVGGRTATVVTDAFNQQTRLEYETATGRLMALTAPPADGAASAQVVAFEYNANGDVTRVTDATGAYSAYTYTANGMVATERLRTGDSITRTYDADSRLLTMTRYGADDSSGNAAHTTRYTYDAKGNLRFAIDAQGGVTEYRYDGYGQQIARLAYTDAAYAQGSGAVALSTMEGWASQRDQNVAEIATMDYDARGNLRTTTAGASVTIPGTATTSTATSATIVARVNTSVAVQPNGLYRVERTNGGGDWNADARSTAAMGDQFVVRIRPSQSNLLMMAGISASPDSSASYSNLAYAFYMTQNGELYATEGANAGIYLGATYAAGDNLWLARSGSTISYYKGDTYEKAIAAGALRSVNTASGTYSFDCSILNAGAAFEAGMYTGAQVPVSTPIANGANVAVEYLTNGGYRLTKTDGVNAAWDADARGTRGFAGDFALSLRPTSNSKILAAGVSRTPGASSSYTDLAYGLYFQTGGALFAMESGATPGLGSYAANEQFWLVRSGTTLSYYRGSSFENAIQSTAIKTTENVTGTLYFDSSLYQTGAAIDVTMSSASALPAAISLTPGANTSVTPQADTGLWRMTKTGGSGFDWDADARSTTSVSGDFVFQVKPVQRDRYMMIGLSTSPWGSSSYTDLDYALYFQDNGNVFAWENRGSAYGLPGTYNANENYWIVRTGSTISYYKGATYDAAIAAPALRTVTGASTAAMWVDSSIAQIGASADVALTVGKPRPTPVAIDGGTNTTRTANGNGTWHVTKTGGANAQWDADARSTTPISGDFQLQIRPSQGDKIMMLGLSTNPAATSDYSTLNYAFYFQYDGNMYAWESGGVTGIGTYGGNQSYWLIREGTTLYYGVGADAATARQNVRRTATGVSGDLYFDSTLYQSGAAADVGFFRPGTGPTTRTAIDKTVGIVTGGGSTGTAVPSGSAGSRTTYVYDTAGQLIGRTTDTLANETFAYDGLGRMISSTDRNGGTTTISFGDAAMQTVVTLASGLVTTSTYNRAGDLVATTESGAYITGGTAVNAYDSLGRVRSTTDASGRAHYHLYDATGRRTADIDENGELTEYRYDAADRLIATVRYDTRLSGAALASVADPGQNPTISSVRPAATAKDLRSWRIYDAGGRLREAINGDGSVTGYDYDASDNLVRTTSYYNKLGAVRLAAFAATPPTALEWPAADGQGRDVVARTFYDRAGRLAGSLDGEGYLTRITYDPAGRKTAQTSYASPTTADRVNGTLSALESGLASTADRTSRWVHDRQGLLRFEIDPLGRVVEYTYDTPATVSETGQVRQAIRYAGTVSLSDFRLASVRAAVAGLASNPDNRRSFTVYDIAGRAAYEIDAAGAVTGYVYDTAGRATKTTRFAQIRATASLPTLADMQGWQAGVNGDGANRVTRSYYTGRGELRYAVDAEGYLTRYTYDAEGRITETRRQDGPINIANDPGPDAIASYDLGPGTTIATSYDRLGNVSDVYDGENNRTHYEYNANGTLLSTYAAFGTTEMSRTVYTYDATGRVYQTYVAYGTPEQQVTATLYDGLGNAIELIDASGNSTRRDYDHAGRVTKESNQLAQDTTYAYNAFDEVIQVTDARGSQSYNFYDRAGRLVVARDAENYVTETSYTVFGEVERIIRRYNRASNSGAATPTVTADTRDATTRFEYDKRGIVTSVYDAENAVERYVLNALGQRRQVTGKTGLVTTYDYDRRGLLGSETAQIAAIAGNAATTITTGHGYDARGNRTSMTEAQGAAEARTTQFFFDRADRLVETRRTVARSVGNTTQMSETLAYDARGNVIRRTDANNQASYAWYDALDRVIATVDATGALVSSTYVVDATGSSRTDTAAATRLNPQAITAGGTAPTVAGNAADRVTMTAFDRLGRVASVSTLGVFTGRWNGTGLATNTGAVTTAYAYDAAGNVVQTTAPDGTIAYAYYDKLGRQTAKVDERGFLTTWVRDGEGNVRTEVRYAAVATGASIATQPTPAPDAATDRRTTFDYDRLGRRTAETRHNVEVTTLNASNDPVLTTAAVTVGYQYNALGQVVLRTEATGEATGYTYDAAGRLVRESRPGFAGASGAAATPTLDYRYDALGNLVRTRQGNAAENAAIDRVTTYGYGAGGRLVAMNDATAAVDATGSRHLYYYDAAGRKTGEQYARRVTLDANGASSWANEGIAYGYDAAGRVVSTAFSTVANGVFTTAGDVTAMTYTAFGEVESRSLNGIEQERNRYDNAGRLWTSNAGDGVQRFYVSDARGNRSYAIESAGADLTGIAKLADAIAQATTANARTIITTAMRYDARGQLVQTVLRQRELVANGALTDLGSTRDYNAFGETLWEQDARGARTDYAYTTTGRTKRITRASVDVTGAGGGTSPTRPYEDYGYDQSGRLVATTDANGNVTRRRMLAGTGYAGAQALVTAEYRPDGYAATMAYDQFGDLRVATDGAGRTTTMAYDALGRLTAQTNARGFTDAFAYDALGQRIRHTNSLLGSGNAEETRYDLQGRVVSARAFGGDTTTTSYGWSASLASVFGTLGGYVKTTTYANTRTATETSDGFGHVLATRDMGDHATSYGFDRGGRVTLRDGDEDVAYGYLNTGLAATATRTGTAGTTIATYGYDETGRKTAETTTLDGATIQSATAAYDLIGRMTRWTEAGSGLTAYLRQDWQYDAVGNIRHVTTTDAAAVQKHLWFAYDGMNRVTIDGGQLVNGQVARGTAGTQIAYNGAGERAYTIAYRQGRYTTTSPDENGGRPIVTTTVYDGIHREDFGYEADGTLLSVRIADSTTSGQDANGDGRIDVTDPTGPGALRSSFAYDPMGRFTRQTDKDESGAVVYDRLVTDRDGKDRVWKEEIATTQATTRNTYAYGDDQGTGYALGQVMGIGSEILSGTGAGGAPGATTYGYAWYEGAQQASIAVGPLGGTPGSNTYYGFTASGALASATVTGNNARSVTVTSDVLGQTIRRTEGGSSPLAETWYRFDGRQVASLGTSTTDTASYAATIDQRGYTSASSRTGSADDLDRSYQAINSYSQGSTQGSYTVRGGDTLAGIAATLWGDAALWYKLAAANGLTADAALVAGTTLQLPANVVRTSNSASTLRPYDPSEAYGDTSPTTPTPVAKAARNNRCGAFGQILLVAVAVAVTVASQGTLAGIAGSALGVGASTTAATVAGGVLAGAAGSIASQGVGVATGLQQGFDWKGVALAGIAGGIGGALKGVDLVSGLGKATSAVNAGLRASIGSAVTQGVGVATGLQAKFDFAGVAAAGIGAGLANGVGGKFGFGGGSFGDRLATNTASGIANAAVRSIANGTSFGDNLMAALPDVIGNTIGNLAASRIASIGREDIDSDLVKYSAEERAEIVGSPVRTVDVPASNTLADDGFWFNKAALGGIPSGSSVLALGSGRFPVTNQLATTFTDPRAGYLSGLEVVGNSLTGTVLVQFDNNRRLAVDESSIIKSMSLINQKASDGYSINLNIVPNNFVNSILHPFSPVVTINLVPTMDGTRAPNSGAYYTREFDSIVMRPDSPRQYIVHEFGHNLGLGHSGYLGSVMFPSTTPQATDHIYLKPGEIKGLVNAYRNRLGN